MGKVVNLRQARKLRGRAEKEARAAENRAAFGRSKDEKQRQEGERRLGTRRHEGHRLSDGEDG